MKVIFLDIDGVLVNKYSKLEEMLAGRPAHEFAGTCVRVLNRITRATGALLVISSTWRLIYDVDTLAAYFVRMGVDARIVGTTPFLRGRRIDEIEEWLKSRPDVEAWCIIDDDADALPDVLTVFDDGLKDDHYTDAVRILSTPRTRPS